MTKADLVNKIHKSNGISKKDSFDILEAVFSLMKDTLESGEKIKVAGFGNFEFRSSGVPEFRGQYIKCPEETEGSKLQISKSEKVDIPTRHVTRSR
jgi:integration host factor subunit alpha